MKLKKGMTIIDRIVGFFLRAARDHVGAYAAQAAYFLILSFIPFLIFLMTVMRYTPISYNMVRHAIMSVVPENLHSFVLSIVAEVYGKSSAVLPIAGLTSLWSAGKAMQSLTNGLNTIFHVKETRGWIITRIYCVFWTFLFVLALLASLLIMVLGNQLTMQISRYVPFMEKVFARVMPATGYLVVVGLFFVFLVLFKVLPNRKVTFRSQIPGAFLTAIAWSVFSYFFSLYFDVFPSFTNMYGSLAAIIAIMLWLDISMILVLYGAEANEYFETEFRQAQISVKTIMKNEKNKKKQRKRILQKRNRREAAEGTAKEESRERTNPDPEIRDELSTKKG